MTLHTDQKIALNQLVSWYRGANMFCVLDSRAGTGKTYLVKHLLQSLNIPVLLLTPTHQARINLENSLGNLKLFLDVESKTIDSALGIFPTTSEKDIKYEHVKLPDLWDDYEFCVIDESSQLSQWKQELIESIGIKILYVGHRSQLPPVEKDRPRDSLCLSPVFEKNYPTIRLSVPKRNLGKGYDFCNFLETLIYKPEKNQNRLVPTDFDIDRKSLFSYLNSPKGIEDLFEDQLKIIGWSNNRIDSANERIKKVLFPQSYKKPFNQKEKLILIEPLTVVEGMARKNDKEIIRATGREFTERLYSNTSLEVVYFVEQIVKLNSDLHIPVYHVAVLYGKENLQIYILKDEKDLEKIATYYEHKAWTIKDTKLRRKAYKERNILLSCFAKVKSFYAATAYRMQGSTVAKVVVFDEDISRDLCLVQQAKTRYVAASRHKEELFYYRGII